MTILNEEQQNALAQVKELNREIEPILNQLAFDFEYAEYTVKQPLVAAVDRALAAGVPVRRLMREAIPQIKYPYQLQEWLEPSVKVRRVLEGDTVEEMDSESEVLSVVPQLDVVTRNASNGEITVVLGHEEYTVRAIGSDDEPWADRDENIPQEVYDMIVKRYPTFMVLD